MPAVSDAFPRIADYAFLSDSRTGALVAPDGSVEWLCPCRFDAPSVFAAILDRDAGGSMRFGPADSRVALDRRYVPGTNVLETTWVAGAARGTGRDALALTSAGIGRSDGSDGVGALVRELRCESGEMEVELRCEPRFAYGAEEATWRLESGEWIASAQGDGAKEEDDIRELRLRASFECEAQAGVLRGAARLREGERAAVSLGWAAEGPDPATVPDLIDRTCDAWRHWLNSGNFPNHRLRPVLQRSALALKGLVYRPRGSMVAALTTSLPEAPGGERNWDYRFTWVRDATFALWSLHVLGFDEEATDFMHFAATLCASQGPESQIVFGIDGETELDERTLGHLDGYEGARPVRVGNAAYLQRQNDVYGALLDALWVHERALGPISDDLWQIARDQIDGAAAVWREPDRGIWEARGEPRHYTSSKLMCWVAFDRGARFARARAQPELASRYDGLASAVRAEILERGVRDGVFRQHYETDALDASLLLVPLVRFLPAHDDRVRATVLAIARDLTENDLVLRYRVHETDDGLAGVEGTFTICSFWLVSALAEIGETERARELCERLLGHAGPLGLYAEELHAASGMHLGNFPQAFTHLALINAVVHVIADETGAQGSRTTFRGSRAANARDFSR